MTSAILLSSTRTGIRTPVAALKGLSPSPLDDTGMPLTGLSAKDCICSRLFWSNPAPSTDVFLPLPRLW
jgi:hypothetical protein